LKPPSRRPRNTFHRRVSASGASCRSFRANSTNSWGNRSIYYEVAYLIAIGAMLHGKLLPRARQIVVPPSPCPLPRAGEGSDASVKGLVFKAFSANYLRKKLNSTNAQRWVGRGDRKLLTAMASKAPFGAMLTGRYPQGIVSQSAHICGTSPARRPG
jgi:hypothetical protein